MYINEVAKNTKLTKKAIEYYIEKGLITPRILDNGYREFTLDDQNTLTKIGLYRKLGLSVDEIVNVLNDVNCLNEVLQRQSLLLENETNRNHILKQLIGNEDIESLSEMIDGYYSKKSILERLLNMFPGYLGRMFSLNYAPYLNEAITSDKQKQAYNTIVAFLDNCPKFEISEELQSYMEEEMSKISNEQISSIVSEKEKNIENYESFVEENDEILKMYMEYKQSEEYKNSPAYELSELLKQFCNMSGYYDTIIPAMRELSSSYNEYYEKLLEANEKFMKEYPEF